ncbi:hypothetical protein PENANT_c044G05599 [Penicillium antarcticum]|uniref:Uncharacterized protein n=1 Tax=Penicillium antarcticum TaxID=416450 RepID=A0A1V6PSR7_9EURO|nr:hypothetical protein PENANT_c044G05599 [Penicillium antarcticum]
MAYELFYAFTTTSTTVERVGFLAWFIHDFGYVAVILKHVHRAEHRPRLIRNMLIGLVLGIAGLKWLTNLYPDDREQVTAYWTGILLQLPIGWCWARVGFWVGTFGPKWVLRKSNHDRGVTMIDIKVTSRPGLGELSINPTPPSLEVIMLYGNATMKIEPSDLSLGLPDSVMASEAFAAKWNCRKRGLCRQISTAAEELAIAPNADSIARANTIIEKLENIKTLPDLEIYCSDTWLIRDDPEGDIDMPYAENSAAVDGACRDLDATHHAWVVPYMSSSETTNGQTTVLTMCQDDVAKWVQKYEGGTETMTVWAK